MNVKEAVQEYHSRGWNVIPLAKNSKEPMAGFTLEPFFNAPYPVDLFKTLPDDINLGIITGKTSDLSVIDIDEPEKFNSYISSFPTDLVQRTPSGGFHLLYKYNPELPDIKKIDGGDFFNGKHYIVASPSNFKNHRYEWLKFGINNHYLSDRLFERRENLSSGKYTRQESLDLLNYALTHDSFRDGQWNDSILYGAVVLAGDGWSKEAIYILLNGINKKGKNPIPDKEVEGMVERAVQYSKNFNKTEPKKESDPKFSSQVQMNIASYGSIARNLEGYEAHWLVDGWLMESSVIICAAPPETYKTWLAVDLGLSIASGLPFLDTYKVNKTGNVLILQQEDFGPRYFSRFNAVERGKLARAKLEVSLEEKDGKTVYSSPYDITDKIFFHTDAEFTLDNDVAIEKLEQRIKETKAIICIIDPFYSLGKSDDYFASIAARIRDKIKAIRNRTGCAFLFIHHSRKQGKKDTPNFERVEIYGSQFVNAVMEGAWMINRPENGDKAEVHVYRRFKDQNPQLPTDIIFNINYDAKNDENAYSLEVDELAEDVSEEIMEYLRTEGSKTFGELYEVFGAKFSSKAGFTRYLRSLVGKGVNQEGKRGKYFVEADAQ